MTTTYDRALGKKCRRCSAPVGVDCIAPYLARRDLVPPERRHLQMHRRRYRHLLNKETKR